ncbi:MAG: outer membrane protein assembly factor BamE [Paracoccaceae bacterium]|nr:outer membrane protein assembly factor BamE [Paracoccaceae bacterium]
MAERPFKLKLALVTVVILALASCSAQFRNHGYVPDETALDEIVVGVDTRDAIDQAFGVPTMSGLRSLGDYYYIRSRVRHLTYKAPIVVERDVVAISFNDNDLVQNIARYTLQDGKVVTLSRRVTDGGDVTRGLASQLFSNIGGLSAEDLLK